MNTINMQAADCHASHRAPAFSIADRSTIWCQLKSEGFLVSSELQRIYNLPAKSMSLNTSQIILISGQLTVHDVIQSPRAQKYI
jgi:hypothetical protein